MRIECIYIANLRGTNYARLLTGGYKSVETRNKRTLDRFRGKPMGILSTEPDGRHYFYGWIRLSVNEPTLYRTEDAWREEFPLHCVQPGSKFAWNEKTKRKYGYRISEYVPVKPVFVHQDSIENIDRQSCWADVSPMAFEFIERRK